MSQCLAFEKGKPPYAPRSPLPGGALAVDHSDCDATVTPERSEGSRPREARFFASAAFRLRNDAILNSLWSTTSRVYTTVAVQPDGTLESKAVGIAEFGTVQGCVYVTRISTEVQEIERSNSAAAPANAVSCAAQSTCPSNMGRNECLGSAPQLARQNVDAKTAQCYIGSQTDDDIAKTCSGRLSKRRGR